MYVKKNIEFNDLFDFFWGGAREKWAEATREQRARVWEEIQDLFGSGRDIPTATEINDFVWFDCDEIFFPEDDEKEESCRHERCKSPRRLSSRNEAKVNGPAEEYIADNIDIFIRNDYPLYKQMKSIVDSLEKKARKGISIDKDRLISSSVIDQLIREALRKLQKEDHKGDNEGIFDRISTATRNLAKKMVAETILDELEDALNSNH